MMDVVGVVKQGAREVCLAPKASVISGVTGVKIRGAVFSIPLASSRDAGRNRGEEGRVVWDQMILGPKVLELIAWIRLKPTTRDK
jgi:hypothetical protein